MFSESFGVIFFSQIWKFRNIMKWLLIQRMEYKAMFCLLLCLIFISFQNNHLLTNINWTFISCSIGFILLNNKSHCSALFYCVNLVIGVKKSKHSYRIWRGSISVARNAQSKGKEGWGLDFCQSNWGFLHLERPVFLKMMCYSSMPVWPLTVIPVFCFHCHLHCLIEYSGSGEFPKL